MINSDLMVVLYPSARLLMLVMTAHVMAVVALIVLNSMWAWLVIVVVVLSAAHHWVRLRSPHITAIDMCTDSCRVRYHGVWMSVQLRSAFVTVPLTVMYFVGQQGRAYYVTVLSDSLSMLDYRYLRIRLRHKA